MGSVITGPLDMIEKRSSCLNNVYFEVLNSFLASKLLLDTIQVVSRELEGSVRSENWLKNGFYHILTSMHDRKTIFVSK